MSGRKTQLATSLQEFVKTHRVRGKCRVCELDMRPMLDEAYRNGAHAIVLLRWLNTPVSKGGGGHPEITDANVRHHFHKAKHYEQA